jgi:hypothetical protein
MSSSASTLTRRTGIGRRDPDRAKSPEAALEPLKAELLRRGRVAAAERLQLAAADDAAIIARGQREADLIFEQARQEGLSEASELIARERTRHRRQARDVVLRAHAAALQQLRERSIAAVVQLATEPGYVELHNRLVGYVRSQLGQDAVISYAPAGGVIGTVTGERLDCSFPALVEQVLADLTSDRGTAWTM